MMTDEELDKARADEAYLTGDKDHDPCMVVTLAAYSAGKGVR